MPPHAAKATHTVDAAHEGGLAAARAVQERADGVSGGVHDAADERATGADDVLAEVDRAVDDAQHVARGEVRHTADDVADHLRQDSVANALDHVTDRRESKQSHFGSLLPGSHRIAGAHVSVSLSAFLLAEPGLRAQRPTPASEMRPIG
jgi:hypothetical protein